MTNQQFTLNGNVQTSTTFTTTNPEVSVQVSQDLDQKVEVYDNEKDATLVLMNSIKQYAHELKCEDFHGKGTIDDYKTLFLAASSIASESSQMALDVDVDGFNEFGQAADELSALFINFIARLENVNIINDLAFLQVIASSLQKIVNHYVFSNKIREWVNLAGVLITTRVFQKRFLRRCSKNQLLFHHDFLNHFHNTVDVFRDFAF